MDSVASSDLDKFAPAYAPDFAYALDNELILNWYPHRVVGRAAGGSLLELGVGHGYATRVLNRHFDRHVIVEGSPAIIRSFRQENPDLALELIEGYFETFDTDETFDAVCMGFVLEHVADPAVVLRRFRRFLKPGGALFVTVPNAESLHRRLGAAAGLLDDLFALGEGDRQLGHQRLFSVSSLRNLLADCGYDVVATEGLFLKPFTTAQIQALALPSEILEALMSVGSGYPELSAALLAHAQAKA